MASGGANSCFDARLALGPTPPRGLQLVPKHPRVPVVLEDSTPNLLYWCRPPDRVLRRWRRHMTMSYTYARPSAVKCQTDARLQASKCILFQSHNEPETCAASMHFVKAWY